MFTNTTFELRWLGDVCFIPLATFALGFVDYLQWRQIIHSTLSSDADTPPSPPPSLPSSIFKYKKGQLQDISSKAKTYS